MPVDPTIEALRRRFSKIEDMMRVVYSKASGSVTSVFGRTGAVTAATNDYTWAQIDKTTSDIADITTKAISSTTGTLAVARGGTGVTTSTGTTNVVLSNSPTLVTPALGTPASGVLTNCTGLPEGGLSTTDITTNDASTTKHGFLKKLPNDATQYIDGTGTFAQVTDADLSLSDITTNNASTTAHGFLKKLDNTATNFMNGQGNWAAPAGGVGYALMGFAGNSSLADATTYYFSGVSDTSVGTLSTGKSIVIPKTGTVKAIGIWWHDTSVTPSNEQSTISFRLNDTTDTTISSTMDISTNPGSLINTGLSIAVTAGDLCTIKWVTPTWATNPTAIKMNAVIYVE